MKNDSSIIFAHPFIIFLIFYPILFEYTQGNKIWLLPIALLLLEILLIFWHKYELRRNVIRYQNLAYARTCCSIVLYAIGYSTLFMGLHATYYDIITLIQHANSDDVSAMDAAIILKAIMNITSGALILLYCRKEHKVLLYSEDSYYLYLRSFLFDEREHSLMWKLPSDRKIMKIGNPQNSLFPPFSLDEEKRNDVLFLPTTDWKKHLDYYIYKAYSIISVVDDTQGVVWEMFHHPNYYYKILFYVENIETLKNLQDKLLESEEYKQSPQLYQCICNLSLLHIDVPFIFWIKDNKCFYDTMLSKIGTLLSSRLNYTPDTSFEIAVDENLDIPVNTDVGSYQRWNAFAKTMSIAQKVLSYINAKYPTILSAIAIVFVMIAIIVIIIGLIYMCINAFIEGDSTLGLYAFLFLGFVLWGYYSEFKSKI